ncbi:MAG: DUF2497 domain-containing protein [Pseudomonadota bacterium]
MSAAEAQAEPTMEEILASIRRIISEDDAPPATEHAPSDGNDVLDLVETAPEPAEETHVSSDFDFDALGEEEEPAFAETPAPEPMAIDDDFGASPDEIIIVDREPDPPEPVYSFDPEPEELAPAPAPSYHEPAAYEPRPMAPLPPQLAHTLGLVGDEASRAAADAFAKVGPMLPGHFANGVSVEELTAHMLKPMLKEWLDKHLPRIVEERVEAELARIARRGF